MPKIGLRNIKTAISVFICVAIYLAIALFANIFYKSFDKSILLATEMYTPFFACIATAYSVHTDKGKSVAQAKLRLVASIIGGLTGVLIITIYTKICKFDWPFSHISATGKPTNGFTAADFTAKYMLSFIVPVILTGVATVLVVWICNLLHQKQTSFIAVLTLTAVMTSLGTEPIIYGFNRIASTIVGILVALGVNLFKLPHYRNKDLLFIVGLDGIYKNDNHNMNGYNSYKANHLVADGANISYYSTRTPISLMKMLDGVTLNYPVVCMSGAALYDTKKLEYLYVSNLEDDVVNELNTIFKKKNISPFYNLIHNDVLYTYNEELSNDGEKLYAKNRKNSAYGAFVEGKYPSNLKICYIVLIEKKDVILEIEEQILNSNLKNNLLIQEFDCYEITNSEEVSGYSYLKIYNKNIINFDAIKMIKDNKQVVACGNHKYDSNLFEYANYSFTIDNAPINLKNESNKVLNTNNNEKIFNELGHLYHKKTY